MMRAVGRLWQRVWGWLTAPNLHCRYCGKPLQAPGVYCSVECADTYEADW